MTIKNKRINFLFLFGIIILVTFLVLSLFGEIVVPYGYDDQDLLAALTPPSSEHYFGTDEIGRDIFSRVVIGTKYTLFVAILSVAIGTFSGVILGLISGFYGGYIDRVITAFIDLLLTIPTLILAIVIASILEGGVLGLIAAISISFTPSFARLVRGKVLEIRSEDYIAAVVTLGISNLAIIFRHVLPNTLTVIFIRSSLFAGQAVLAGTALGFLGLGVAPPLPEWGTMLGNGKNYMDVAPYILIAPGIAISLMVLGFNLVGDGLRDYYDPHMES